MPVTLRFFGAVGTVTGSRFLLECEDEKILVDAGLFQGLRELRDRNWDSFPVDVSKISAIVITHAHLDHCGYLPRLIAQGFRGKIHMTHYTAKLAAVVLRDSASLQVEDAKYAKKKGFSKHKDPKPLYSLEDAERAIALFDTHPYGQPINISKHGTVTFKRSGHILGSSSVLISFCEKEILFSGDLGRPHHPILQPPDPLPIKEIDAVVIESTYGDRTHPAKSNDLADAINRTVKRGGTVLIPAFAIDRTEILLMSLKELVEKKLIPNIPIYVDSPMALTALHEYQDAIKNKSPEIRAEILIQSEDPFDVGDLREAKSVDESKALNNPTSSSIIISASGMATGGRVVHHLEWLLPDAKNSVLLVGYQAVGTRGQKLLSGVKELKMYGALVPVRAEIVQIEEFSVHGDAQELIEWLKSGAKAKQLFVVHGEKSSADSFAQKVERELHWNVVVPSIDKPFAI